MKKLTDFHCDYSDNLDQRGWDNPLSGDGIVMDFPVYGLNKVPVTDDMATAMGATPKEAYLDRDLLLVYEDEDVI